MLSVSLVFGVNDLLALKAFNTFLNNFQIHEKPTFIESWFARRAQSWIQNRAMKIFNEIRKETATRPIDVALNQCSTGMFAVLSLSITPSFNPSTGEDIFLSVANTELTFEKLRSPKADSLYQ